MKRYWLYGLQINSELELPTLVPRSEIREASDYITIRWGKAGDLALEQRIEGILYQVNAHQYLLEIPGLARYRVSYGCEITIEANEQADEASIRLFLLGPVMGVLLHQRRMFSIRGSCIAEPNGAVIFAGVSGTGKSTLAAAFHQLGSRILADDISVIQAAQDGSAWVLPGAPELKLWRSTLEALHFPQIETRGCVRPGIDKYVIPFPNDFEAAALPLRAIYVLNPVNRDEFAILPLENLLKLPNLTNLTYQRHLALETGAMAAYWEIAADIAPQVRMAYLNRPVRGFELDPLIDMIKEDLCS